MKIHWIKLLILVFLGSTMTGHTAFVPPEKISQPYFSSLFICRITLSFLSLLSVSFSLFHYIISFSIIGKMLVHPYSSLPNSVFTFNCQQSYQKAQCHSLRIQLYWGPRNIWTIIKIKFFLRRNITAEYVNMYDKYTTYRFCHEKEFKHAEE